MTATLQKIKDFVAKASDECQIKNPERLPLFKFLYQPGPDSAVEKGLQSAERVTRLRREQLFCVIICILTTYFLISSVPQLAAQLIGVGYPIYGTVLTLRGYTVENSEALKSWLTYWTVYGAFSLVDSVLLPVLYNISVYWLAKIVFLFYLVFTQPLGSTELLEKVIYPAIDRLDMFFTKLFDGSAIPASPKKNGKKK